MFQRTSIVDNIRVFSVSYSSILQIGDSKSITPISRALAVQREYELFYDEEGDFNSFPIFTQPIPQPNIHEKFNLNIKNESPTIKVHNLNILGVSNSAIAHVGSTRTIEAVARVKHIRQLAE